jgi:hypothetical protein
MGPIHYLPFVNTVGIRQWPVGAANTGFNPFTGPDIRAMSVSNKCSVTTVHGTREVRRVGHCADLMILTIGPLSRLD